MSKLCGTSVRNTVSKNHQSRRKPRTKLKRQGASQDTLAIFFSGSFAAFQSGSTVSKKHSIDKARLWYLKQVQHRHVSCLAFSLATHVCIWSVSLSSARKSIRSRQYRRARRNKLNRHRIRFLASSTCPKLVNSHSLPCFQGTNNIFFLSPHPLLPWSFDSPLLLPRY